MFTTRFSPELAKEYGMSESVLFLYIADRVRMREKDVRNLYEGAWTCSTLRELAERFPCWSTRTIQKAMVNLEKEDLIQSTRLSSDRRDRTKWYTLTEKGRKTLRELSE